MLSTMFKKQLTPKLRMEHLWPLAVLAGVFILVSTYPIRPHDFWWHLKAGQEIVLSGRIPSVDTFSYTMAGAPYDNYASYWLMEVAYYFALFGGRPGADSLLPQPAGNGCLCLAAPAVLAGQPELAHRGRLYVVCCCVGL